MDASTPHETARDEAARADLQHLESALGPAFGELASQGSRCVLLGLCVDRLDHLAEDGERERALQALGRMLAERPESGTWSSARTTATWWVLVPNSDAKQGLALARALVTAGREIALEARGGKARRFSISCGVASTGHASRPSLATCAAVVAEGLRVAAASGGRRAVHSEVYSAFAVVPAQGGAHVQVAKPGQASTPSSISSAQRPDSLRQVELPRAPAAAAATIPATPARPSPAPALANGHRTGAALPKEPLAPVEGTSGEMLQRRLTKLVTELEKAEAEIARLRAQVAREGEGLASIYREVQGLSEDAASAELKREMMARLFEANLALRALAASGERAELPA
jgi:hypothetical protein